MEILSLSEQTTLQEYLVNQLDSLNLGILICLYTGIRVGELCALTWEKISFSDKTICNLSNDAAYTKAYFRKQKRRIS